MSHLLRRLFNSPSSTSLRFESSESDSTDSLSRTLSQESNDGKDEENNNSEEDENLGRMEISVSDTSSFTLFHEDVEKVMTPTSSPDFLHLTERQLSPEDDPDMVILDCAGGNNVPVPGKRKPSSDCESSGQLSPLSPAEAKPKDLTNININTSAGDSVNFEEDSRQLEDSVFLNNSQISGTGSESSSSTSRASSTPSPNSTGGKKRGVYHINSGRSASDSATPKSSISASSNCFKNRSFSAGDSPSEEKEEFNDWQFWRFDATPLPNSIVPNLFSISGTNDINNAENEIITTTTSEQQSQSPLLPSPDADIKPSHASLDESTSSTTSADHYYYLLPCRECLNEKRGRNPTIFFVEENNPAFCGCGHRRSLTKASREHLLRYVVPEEEEECRTISDSDFICGHSFRRGKRTIMGNQTGKESKGKSGKGKKDQQKDAGAGVNVKKRDHTSTTTPGKSLKNRPAPLPPGQEPGAKPPSGVLLPELHLSIVEDEVEDTEGRGFNGEADNDLSDVESLTVEKSFRTAATDGLTGTESYHTALGDGTWSRHHLDDDDDTLQNQSDQLSLDSFELTMPTAEMGSNGNLVFDEDEEGRGFGTLLGSEIINSRALTLNITRKRKVELSSVSSPVDEIHPPLGGRKDSTASEQCLTGSDHHHDHVGVGINCVPPRRYASVSEVPPVDSNVLRKAHSLSLAEQQQMQKLITRPKYIPETLDFKQYQKFEGLMLINWFMTTVQEGNMKEQKMSQFDLRLMANHFCTMLLASGVLKQIEDSTSSSDPIFKADLMYHWTHSEATPSLNSPPVPGKLSSAQWPPTAPSKPGAKYTEAGDDVECDGCGVITNVRTLSPEHLPKPGIVPENINHFESQNDLSRSTQDTKEFQNVVMGLKREQKEVLEKKENEHEQNLFSVRGETADLLKKYATRIEELEQEVEKLKTLQDIQNLNQQLNVDFDKSAAPQPPSGPPPPPPPPLPTEPPPYVAPPPPPPPMCGMPPPPPMPGSFGGPPPPPPPPGMGMGGPPPPPPPPGMGGPPPPPPPPGMGGPPPPPPPGMGGPPPPMMMMAKQEARKKPITPSVPMKPLFWKRIQIKEPPPPVVAEPSGALAESLTDTKPTKLWEKLDELPVQNWEDFNKLFARQVVEKKVATKEQEVKKPVKAHAQKVLDAKRSQNVGILIKSLNLDIEHVKQAIFDFDMSVISTETLEKILDIKATPEEAEALKATVECSPGAPLDKPEQFLYDLLSITNYEARILSLTFQCNYFEQLSSVESKLSNLGLVSEKLTASKDLQKVLALVLTYGNYMNGGNRERGQADGFTIDILPKLKETKSNESNVTFLHFIVNKYIEMEGILDKDNPEDAKLPVPEPSDIEKASCCNFDDIEKEINSLKSELKKCENRMQQVLDTSEPEQVEPFRSKMTKFIEHAKEKLKEVEETFQHTKNRFENTLAFFDFTTTKKADNPVFEFFSTWTPFCNDFKIIWRNEQQRRLKEKLKEAEKIVQQKRGFLRNLIQKKPREHMGLKDKIRKKKEAT